MKVSRLVKALGLQGFEDVEVTDIVYDSRKALQGCAFV